MIQLFFRITISPPDMLAGACIPLLPMVPPLKELIVRYPLLAALSFGYLPIACRTLSMRTVLKEVLISAIWASYKFPPFETQFLISLNPVIIGFSPEP